MLSLLFFPNSTKFADNKWLYENDLLDYPGPFPTWWALPISSLPARQPSTISSTATCCEALRKMKQDGVNVVPVLGDKGLVKLVCPVGHIPVSWLVVHVYVCMLCPCGCACVCMLCPCVCMLCPCGCACVRMLCPCGCACVRMLCPCDCACVRMLCPCGCMCMYICCVHVV